MQVQSKVNSTFLPFTSMLQLSSQHNLIVLLVDDLSAPEPELDGIWLLIASSNQPVIHLVPVNAESFLSDQPADFSLHGFKMSAGKQPNREFLDRLSDRILWDDFLVIERSRWNSLVTSLQDSNSGSTGDSISSDLPAADSFQFLLDDSQQQLQDWIVICSHLSQLSTPDHFRSFLDQLASSSLAATRDLKKLSHLPWVAQGEASALRCEFPTLNFEYP